MNLFFHIAIKNCSVLAIMFVFDIIYYLELYLQAQQCSLNMSVHFQNIEKYLWLYYSQVP